MNNLLTLNIGPSNTGKTYAGILPQIREVVAESRSFVAVDSKNVILPNVGNLLVQSGYTILTFDIRDTAHSHSWNPLFLPYQLFRDNDKEKCYHVLSDLASDIFVNNNDFWEASAKDLFIGLCLLLFNEATDINQINLRSVYYLAMIGFEKFSNSNYMQEYLNLKDEKFSLLATSVQITSSTASDTRQGILSTFYQSLRSFTANDTIVDILSNAGITIEDVLKEKTALFLHYEDENPQNAKIVNVFIMQIYRTLLKQRSNGSCVEKYYSFFFDDFLSLPKFTKLDDVLLGYKSRKITINLSINNVELLKKKYGKETTAALLSNADCIHIYYDIMCEYNKYFNKEEYQDALKLLTIDKMLRLTLNGFELIDINALMEIIKEEELYKHSYQNQDTTDISYYNFDEIVKKMKRDDYMNHVEKLKENLDDKKNPTMEAFLDLLNELSE